MPAIYFCYYKMGVFVMKVSQTIDWISCTFACDAVYPGEYETVGEHLERGIYGYTRVFRYDDGRLEMSNPLRPHMGTHVIVSGSALRECEVRYGHSVFGQFVWYHSRARIRRLDIAIDVRDSGMKVGELSEHIRRGWCATRQKSAPAWVDALNEGETQYIGKKSSSSYLKIYDKAAEQKVDGEWIRIEATFQKRRAVPAARALASGASIQSLILSVADFPRHDVWRKIMTERAEYVRPEQKASETEAWLLKTVAPALARVSMRNPKFLGEFNKIVSLMLEEMFDNTKNSP